MLCWINQVNIMSVDALVLDDERTLTAKILTWWKVLFFVVFLQSRNNLRPGTSLRILYLKRCQRSRHITVRFLQNCHKNNPIIHTPDKIRYTVYPKKYAHGFVVLCFVVVMQSFIMNSHEVFIHIHQGCFAGTGAIVRLPQCQWSKPDGYGKISQCITTTKHSKAKTVCIFLGIYCTIMGFYCISHKAPQKIPDMGLIALSIIMWYDAYYMSHKRSQTKG